MDTYRAWPAAGLVAVGLIVGGYLVGRGFEQSRLGDRFVTVKGVAEREVEADLAIWNLQFTAGGNDLAAVQRQIAANVELTLAFLERNGISRDLVSVTGLRVVDAAANPYQQGPVANRYSVTQTVLVRSEEPDVVDAASQNVSELVEAGVVLVSGQEWGPGGPTFVFRGLNDIKPMMIAEATARAREAAVEFARDSESELGRIRRANQGVFEILPRDPAPDIQESNRIDKTVRVVTTVDYYLR
jgi:uncharacterized protein